MRRLRVIVLLGVLITALGCFTENKISVFGKFPQPLTMVVAAGNPSAEEAVALIDVKGIISADAPICLGECEPSVLASVLARLRLAESNSSVKAVVLLMDSPGGTVSASDTLYTEILRFKRRTGKPVVAFMDGVCASGCVYAAVAADKIIVHSTAVTGSIGVLFQSAELVGLMDKAGVKVRTITSGKYKDMGSPFREMTDEERRLIRGVISELFDRFVNSVATSRGLKKDEVLSFADGRIFTAQEAVTLKLADKVGSLYDAWKTACELAGIRYNSSALVVWRPYETYNETPYGPAAATRVKSNAGSSLNLIGLAKASRVLSAGFYYIWPAYVFGI